MGRERHTATLASMGLRAEASLAKHILLENCLGNNLLPDISKVDYLGGRQGRTNLQPLDGLSLFVDNIYICGCLDQTEVVRTRGKVSCEPVAEQIVARISMAAQQVLGGPRKNNRISSLSIEAESAQLRHAPVKHAGYHLGVVSGIYGISKNPGFMKQRHTKEHRSHNTRLGWRSRTTRTQLLL